MVAVAVRAAEVDRASGDSGCGGKAEVEGPAHG